MADNYFCVSRGRARWDYSIYNDDVIIYLNREPTNGQYYQDIHVVYASPFLWRVGCRAAVQKITEWLAKFASVTQERVSRADICQDVLAALPTIKEDWSNVKTKSFKRTRYIGESVGRGVKRTGFSFGGGDLLLRIYDKTQEIKNSHKEWFLELWGDIPDGGPVTRVEYQIRRNILRSFNPPINTPAELFDSIEKIWDYLCHSWFRLYRGNQFWWADVKHYAGVEPAQEICREHVSDPEYKMLLAQAVGCITSCMSLDMRVGRALILSQIDKVLCGESAKTRLAVKTIARSYI